MSYADKLALIIGIDTYDSKDLDPLPSCKKDAQDLYHLLLKQSYVVSGNAPLIGSELGSDGWVKIRKAIFDFFKRARPSQMLLFYFSGHGIHGGSEIYLATSQVDPKEPGFAGFHLSELTRLIGSSKSKQIVAIIDACFSGTADLPNGAMKKKAARDNAGRALATYDKIWTKTPKTKGMDLLLSSQAYEPSNAVQNSNSLYTKYLLEGLAGVKPNVLDQNGRLIQWSGSVEYNGDVTPNSLHDYVYHKVAEIAEQVPDHKSDRSSNITLLSYPELAFQSPSPELKQVKYANTTPTKSAAEHAQVPLTAQPALPFCTSCHEPILSDDMYCGSCGSQLSPQVFAAPSPTQAAVGEGVVACPTCGFMNEPDSMFCGEDGTPLQKARAGLPPPASR